MAALMGSIQPFPLRQISLNDLLNADISSIVTSFSQPHGKMNEITCSNVLLEGSFMPEWDSNKPATEHPAVSENESTEVWTDDLQQPKKSASRPLEMEDGGIFSNFSSRSVGWKASFNFLAFFHADVDLASLAQDFCQVYISLNIFTL
jgi:hypothetical protein